MRNSRWSTEPRLKDGKPKRVEFSAYDLGLCKLYWRDRNPWGYQYLTAKYSAALLGRHPQNVRNRLSTLVDEPGAWFQLPPQPINNYRDIIYALGKNGATELRENGMEMGRIRLKPLPHEFLITMCGASFEISKLPIQTRDLTFEHVRPDLPPFDFNGRLIFLEADMHTETIDGDTNATNVITHKYKEAINLLHTHDLKDALFLFVTIRTARMESMIEALKRYIDTNNLDQDIADHFGFMVVPPKITDSGREVRYDRYINAIPLLTPWIVDNPCFQAGRKPYPSIKLKDMKGD